MILSNSKVIFIKLECLFKNVDTRVYISRSNIFEKIAAPKQVYNYRENIFSLFLIMELLQLIQFI